MWKHQNVDKNLNYDNKLGNTQKKHTLDIWLPLSSHACMNVCVWAKSLQKTAIEKHQRAFKKNDNIITTSITKGASFGVTLQSFHSIFFLPFFIFYFTFDSSFTHFFFVSDIQLDVCALVIVYVMCDFISGNCWCHCVEILFLAANCSHCIFTIINKLVVFLILLCSIVLRMVMLYYIFVTCFFIFRTLQHTFQWNATIYTYAKKEGKRMDKNIIINVTYVIKFIKWTENAEREIRRMDGW